MASWTCSTTCPRSRVSSQMSCASRRAKQKDRPKAVSIGKRAGYILSWVFFIFSDLVIFFLLTLSFDISPLDMLSLWAAGPVVGGLVVSVD